MVLRRKKDKFLGYLDRLGRPVYGYSGTLNNWKREWEKGDRAARINNTADEIMASLEDDSVSNEDKLDGIDRLHGVFSRELDIYAMALNDINAILETQRDSDAVKMKKMEKYELIAMSELISKEVAIMAMSQNELKKHRVRFANPDEMTAWLRDNYKAGDTAGLKSHDEGHGEDVDVEAYEDANGVNDSAHGRKGKSGKKRGNKGAANWAKTGNGSMRITKKSYIGPFVVNWSTRGPSSVAYRLGFLTFRLWSASGSANGLSSVDLPGPLSWRANRSRSRRSRK